jgi:hypothetical protein
LPHISVSHFLLSILQVKHVGVNCGVNKRWVKVNCITRHSGMDFHGWCVFIKLSLLLPPQPAMLQMTEAPSQGPAGRKQRRASADPN